MSDEPQKTKKDEFLCDSEKFIKMIRFLKTVRTAQQGFFKSKSSRDLAKAKELEKKLDKAIEFYTLNEGELHDCPF